MRSRGTPWVLLLCVVASGLAAARAAAEKLAPGNAAWRRAVGRTVAPVSVAEMTRETMVADGPVSLRGARAKLIVRDSQGRKYMFKQHDPAQTWPDREHFAQVLRQAAGEPHAPVAVTRVKLPDGRVVEGTVKPFLASEGELPANPRRWTAGLIAAVLADHAWAEMLGNYDTKTDQSLVIQPAGLRDKAAINIDWDLSLTDYVAARPVSRHKAMNSGPPAHNLLYNAFVHGRLDVDFAPLRDAVGRIQAIPDATVVQAMQPFLTKAFAGGKALGPYRTAAQLVSAVLARKASLGQTFESLIGELEGERAEHAAGTGRYAGLGKVRSETRDARMVAWGRFIQSPAFERFQKMFRHFAGDLPPESPAFTR
jgi:hypothetical protein